MQKGRPPRLLLAEGSRCTRGLFGRHVLLSYMTHGVSATEFAFSLTQFAMYGTSHRCAAVQVYKSITAPEKDSEGHRVSLAKSISRRLSTREPSVASSSASFLHRSPPSDQFSPVRSLTSCDRIIPMIPVSMYQVIQIIRFVVPVPEPQVPRACILQWEAAQQVHRQESHR